ncbi:MAG: sigma-70 family RNA polymerase sigma factor [Nakamurella sp.]
MSLAVDDTFTSSLASVQTPTTPPVTVLADRASRRVSSAHSERNREATLDILRQARETTNEKARQRLLDQVVTEHMRYAHSMASRFRGRGVDYDDLVQVAYLGLVKAAQGCDPERCADFMQYATPTIMGELKRHFRDHAWSVRPPRRLQEIQPLLTSTRNGLTQKLGRQPTSREVADEMGVPTEQVAEAVVAGQGFSTASLDPFSDGFINSGSEDPKLTSVENMDLLSNLFGHLTDRERKVLLLRYYLGWTQSEIGADLGFSQMQISRTLRSAMTKLTQSHSLQDAAMSLPAAAMTADDHEHRIA